MARPPSAAGRGRAGRARAGLEHRLLALGLHRHAGGARQRRAARFLEEQDLLLLADDHRALRAHDHLAVAVERVGVDRRIGHDDPVLLALAGELEDGEDVVVDLAAVGVEERAADAGDRQRVLLAQEDRAGVELVAAQLGHQAGAGAVVEPPVDQLVEAVVAVFLVVDVLVRRRDESASSYRGRRPSPPRRGRTSAGRSWGRRSGCRSCPWRPGAVALLRCQRARMWRMSPSMSFWTR